MIRYNLDRNNQGIEVSPELYGLFFEDINGAADGGLNAEMIINNSFEHEYYTYDPYNAESPVTVASQKGLYWDIYGAGPRYISTDGGISPGNPSYLCLNVGGIYHVENPGYGLTNSYDLYGMAIDKGETYHFSMFVKKMGFVGTAKVFIRSKRGVRTTVAQIPLSGNDGSWEKVCCDIVATETKMGRLCVVFEGNGTIGIDYLSLLPDHTWGDPDKYRNGKLSPRIVNVIKDAHPKFFRFPGGCVVEGDVDFDHMYKWRNTVGPLERRKQIANVWQYLQSYGIGFYEYFALCEDLQMTPLPVLHCGLLCQIRMGEQRKTAYQRIMPGTPMFQYEVIDNVADLLYFAKGDVDSPDPAERHWASVRASMGHPAPFELKYVGIGNENWGYEYFDNFAACLLGLRQYNYCGKPVDLLKKFDITVVTTSGVDIRPQDSSDNWKVINRLYRDMIVDEHVYNSYQWFIDNSKRYDSYDRTGAKVFMGEYSVHTSADGRGRLNGDNNLRTALGEAVFLTGCERNSDVVRMTCYAPLFAATNNYRWTPDLIWFNSRDIMLTPNYYVQKYFAQFYGKYLLNDVAPVNNDNSGGLIIGGHRTTSAVRSVTVRSLATGEVLYTHSFKDGLGGWKVYPNCKGGYINAEGELVIEQSDAFNGYFFDDKTFGNCEVEIDFRRVSGEQSFIAGVGAADIRDAGTMDCAGFSVCCQYGKNHKGYDVSFDKRVDFIRTVCELMGKDKFFGYSAEGNKIRLVYTETKFKASFFKDGQWHEILDKNIWKVNERVFQSATFDEHGIYLKCVNVSGAAQDFEVNISSFGEMKKAHMYLLHHKDPLVTNEIGMRSGVENNIVPVELEIAIRDNKLCFHLEDNSVAVLVIE